MEIDTQARSIGIMGGTFDPIHYGHLVVAEEVRETLKLAEMIFIPVGSPPHKRGKPITPAVHRLAMLELALASNPHFSISHIEVERPGPSYTVDTLRQLHAQMGTETALYFVIGWDSLEDLSTWHDPAGMLAELTHLVAVRRPGYEEGVEAEPAPSYDHYQGDEPVDIYEEFLQDLENELPGIRERLLVVPAPQLEISATDLRQRVATGRPIKYQTPENVVQYIADHNLYRDGSLNRR